MFLQRSPTRSQKIVNVVFVCGISQFSDIVLFLHPTRWRNKTQFRQICLFTLDFTQEINIAGNSQETSL